MHASSCACPSSVVGAGARRHPSGVRAREARWSRFGARAHHPVCGGVWSGMVGRSDRCQEAPGFSRPGNDAQTPWAGAFSGLVGRVPRRACGVPHGWARGAGTRPSARRRTGAARGRPPRPGAGSGRCPAAGTSPGATAMAVISEVDRQHDPLQPADDASGSPRPGGGSARSARRPRRRSPRRPRTRPARRRAWSGAARASTLIAPGSRKWSDTTYAIRRRATTNRHSSRAWTTTSHRPEEREAGGADRLVEDVLRHLAASIPAAAAAGQRVC